MTARLEGIALDFGYPGHAVGRGVSIALGAGEIVCLLGPNGGGKSTLFRTLMGLLPAQGGEVRLDGEPLASLSRTAIAKRVSYVPQAHAGYFPFTMRDVVLMGRTAHLSPFAAPGKHDVAIADACLENQIANCRRDHHDFRRHDAAVAVFPWQETLRHHRVQRFGNSNSHGVLLFRWEHRDDTHDGRHRVRRVQRRHEQVARLGRLERRVDRLCVAHLTDQHNVRILAQCGLEAVAEAVRIDTDFTLRHR